MKDPIDLTQMSDADLDALIIARQERRLKQQKEYEAAVAAKALAREQGLEEKLEKQLALLEKDLKAVDTKLDKASERLTKIAAIRLELGDYRPNG